MATNNSINAPFPFATNKGGTATDISQNNVQFVVGTTQAALPGSWQGATNTSYSQGFNTLLITDGPGAPENYIVNYGGTDVFMNTIVLVASRGTMASPSPVLTGDTFWRIGAAGQTGTAIDNTADGTEIRGMVESDFDGTPAASLRFSTRNTTDSNPVERVKIDETGLLTAAFGMSSPSLTLTTTPLAPASGGTGTNINANSALFTLGTTQAALPDYWKGASFTVYSNASSVSPGFPFYAVSDADNGGQYYFANYAGSGIYNTGFILQGSRGTLASPTAILNNDIVGRFVGVGQTGTAIDAASECVNIRFVAEDNFATNPSCGIHFFTQQTAGGGLLERAKIDKTGLLTASFGISSTALTLTSTPLAIGSGGTGQATKAPAFDALSPTTTSGDLSYRGNSANIRLATGTVNQVLTVVDATPGAVVLGWSAAGTGTVTSVGLTSTSLDVTGTSPITGAGTFNIELADAYAPIVTGGAADTVGKAAGITTATTINTTEAHPGSIILLTMSNLVGLVTTLPQVYVGAVVDGVSFDIALSLGTLTSLDVNWTIVNP